MSEGYLAADSREDALIAVARRPSRSGECGPPPSISSSSLKKDRKHEVGGGAFLPANVLPFVNSIVWGYDAYVSPAVVLRDARNAGVQLIPSGDHAVVQIFDGCIECNSI